jgi:glycosyltransferase involved in cell wall biosynthesis
LVSVVIPCYNQGRFLADAIRSVFSQTYPHVETTVVDDGSTDRTAAVVDELPPARLVSQRNSGAAVARNLGMRQSRGDYLVFLDADDRLLPDAVATGVGWLGEHPDCAFVTGHVRLIAEDGTPAGVPPQNHGTTYVDLLRSNYIWTPGAVMYRRDALGDDPFDPKAGGSADYELNIRLARAFAFGCHHQVVLEYRQHGSNMSGDSRHMLRSAVTVRRSLRRHVGRDREARRALETGIRLVQADFGGRVVAEVKADVRAPARWLHALRGAACLLRFHPAGLARVLRRGVARPPSD